MLIQTQFVTTVGLHFYNSRNQRGYDQMDSAMKYILKQIWSKSLKVENFPCGNLLKHPSSKHTHTSLYSIVIVCANVDSSFELRALVGPQNLSAEC